MHTTTWARRLRAVLLLPLLALLAACGSFHGTLEVRDVDTLDVNFELGIEKDIASMSGISSAQALCDEFSSEDGGVTGPDKADPSETEDMYVCTVAGTIARENFDGDFQLTEADGEYHLVVTPGDAGLTGADAFGDIDFRLTVEFPGKVIESSGGTVDGKTVTYTDLNEFASTGIDIRAEAGGNGLVWVIVGVVALLVALVVLAAVIVAIVLLLRRRRRTTTPTVPGGYAGTSGTASVPPAPSAYGGAGSPSYGSPMSPPAGQQPPFPGPGVQPPTAQSAQPSAAPSSSWASPGPQAPVQPPHHGSHTAFPGQGAPSQQAGDEQAAAGQQAPQPWAEQPPAPDQEPWRHPEERG